MNLRDHRTRTLTALVTAALAVSMGSAAAADASPQIKSGAGKGWPKTLRASDFVAHVDNPWFPLKPGSTYRYRGSSEGTPIVDQFKVTHRTKRILGVRTTVVHDEVLIHGKSREVTEDWYAQDRRGNVWYFGERTMELNRHGQVVSREGSFEAGVDGARAGVYISAHAAVGDRARQESYKGQAEDHFKVIERGAHVSGPFITTDHAVRTRERTPLEPRVVDNKFYAYGIGTVREKTVKGPQEVLDLVAFSEG